MRATLTALAFATLAASSVQAQDAQRWEGFYAGVLTNIISPEFDRSDIAVPLQEGTNFGAFGGYNYAANDRFVIGAELYYGSGVAFQTREADPDFEFDNVMNARIRGGYALGNALLYGTVGYQQVNYGAQGGVSNEGSASGPVYGIGIEMLLTDNVSVRIDYTSTHMDPDAGTIIAPGVTGDTQIDANAVGLGVALHF